MSALLRAELLKLRTTRTFVTLTGVTLLLSLTATVLFATLGDGFDENDVHQLFFSRFVGLFIALLGVMGMAGEWRHRTITGAILAAPHRLRLLAAKTVSYAVAGMVMSLAVTVMTMIVGLIILSARGETTLPLSGLADVLWRNLLIAALLGAFGVVVGGVVRSQVAALIGLLVLAFVIEGTILGGLVPEVAAYGPMFGLPSGIADLSGSDSEDLLAPGTAILVMFAWIGVFFGVAAATLRARDLE